eukprot:5544174-Prorocentrum_lima.AAC.1
MEFEEKQEVKSAMSEDEIDGSLLTSCSVSHFADALLPQTAKDVFSSVVAVDWEIHGRLGGFGGC